MFPSLRLGNSLQSLKSRPGLNALGSKNKIGQKLLKGSSLGKQKKNLIHPTQPARTRFAPSPTGMLHLGSLRTALYNYLLAKQTGGQFIVRLEDTDQNRLVPGAEANVYSSLRWVGIVADESPEVGGPVGPYKQSERAEIYKKYVDILLSKGLAYKCYCSKERLVKLRESAQKLQPPTTVTYDRKCLHNMDIKSSSSSLSSSSSADSSEFVVRFKSPDTYPITEDLQRGSLDIQAQYNQQDRRYDDFVIMKLDGLPTYHFANVVDDHLMGINYVIRGEEWLTSTPKHLALYQAFEWTPPKFVHVPLLTSLDEKKLSKRHGDISVYNFQEKGVTPEALVNFVALFGWSPKRETHGKKVKEIMLLPEMIEKFRLDDMTRGNTKVSEAKLWYFNRHHMPNYVSKPENLSQLADSTFDEFFKQTGGKFDKEYYKECLAVASGHLDTPSDLSTAHLYFFQEVDYESVDITGKEWMLPILNYAQGLFDAKLEVVEVEQLKSDLVDETGPRIMQSLRFALTGSVPGVDIMSILRILGNKTYGARLRKAIAFLKSKKKTNENL